mgnify:CR=1 FL=1
MVDMDSVAEQARLFGVLASELRLQLLAVLAEETVSAPELADRPEFDVTAETIHNNLKQLREVGLVESERIYGPGNRPKDAFSLSADGFELVLTVADEYSVSVTTLE